VVADRISFARSRLKSAQLLQPPLDEVQKRQITPRVSVLMPVFNTVEYLRPALESISHQTFSDFEFIVIDDGSNDGSTGLLQSYALLEPRMILIARDNLGLVATRNELLARATGELVAWMDSDDLSLPDRLSSQVEAFAADDQLACVGGVAQCIDPEGNLLNIERYPLTHDEILVEQQKGGAMRFATTMMRRQIALAIGGFRGPFKVGEDFDFLLRLSEIGKMANLPTTLYLYRQHLSSACGVYGSNWGIYRDQILDLARERREHGRDRLEKGDRLELGADVSPDRRSSASDRYASWALHALQNGNRRIAWKHAKTAVSLCPTHLYALKAALRVLLNTKRNA
jgi:glycosyltransferase involved in cell wall biosynthesis